jgi:uncharacterized surface protein with fasciclin (FAS1) repeats
MKVLLFLISICSFFLLTSCEPDAYEYPPEGEWFEPGLAHKIAMHDGDKNNGTYEFFEFAFAAQIDKGVAFDRRMSQLLTYPPPGFGMDGKWTVFVLNNSNVNAMSSKYYKTSPIQKAASTTERRRQIFKLFQYYFVVGEYKASDLPASLKMDNGFVVNISGTTMTGADGNTVNIVSTDNVTRNGIFHVIDGPLHPTDPKNYVYIDESYFYTFGSDNPDKREWNPYQ